MSIIIRKRKLFASALLPRVTSSPAKRHRAGIDVDEDEFDSDLLSLIKREEEEYEHPQLRYVLESNLVVPLPFNQHPVIENFSLMIKHEDYLTFLKAGTVKKGKSEAVRRAYEATKWYYTIPKRLKTGEIKPRQVTKDELVGAYSARVIEKFLAHNTIQELMRYVSALEGNRVVDLIIDERKKKRAVDYIPMVPPEFRDYITKTLCCTLMPERCARTASYTMQQLFKILNDWLNEKIMGASSWKEQVPVVRTDKRKH